MSANKFIDVFKCEAFTQVEDRGYPVRDVAERLGLTPSRYTLGSCYFRTQ
jgi:transposase